MAPDYQNVDWQLVRAQLEGMTFTPDQIKAMSVPVIWNTMRSRDPRWAWPLKGGGSWTPKNFN
jgi:hypothetical protein